MSSVGLLIKGKIFVSGEFSFCRDLNAGTLCHMQTTLLFSSLERPLRSRAQRPLDICNPAFEGFGLCNFEHAALGIPQVVPRIGGFLDFFDDSGNCMFKLSCSNEMKEPPLSQLQQLSVSPMGQRGLWHGTFILKFSLVNIPSC
jgi:hypothetical protein